MWSSSLHPWHGATRRERFWESHISFVFARGQQCLLTARLSPTVWWKIPDPEKCQLQATPGRGRHARGDESQRQSGPVASEPLP